MAILAVCGLLIYFSHRPQEKSVVLFEQCGYVGRQHYLKPGFYPTSQLGIADNSLSCVQIPDGMAVQVFEYDGQSGRTATFESSISCLPGDWNDRVSAIRVFKVDTRGSGNPTLANRPAKSGNTR